MAPVSGSRFRDHNELTGEGINGIISYWPASQKTRWHDARICLGETRTDAFNRFDLCYSFKVLCQAEYGGTRQLHHAAKNYARNYGLTAGLHQNRRILYERVLRNLVVLRFSHYVNHLECTSSLKGHRTLMVHECRCFDNVYFCGWIIRDLPMRGRAPHSEERTKTIYDQEYKELVHRLENMLDLPLRVPLTRSFRHLV